jgi:hypothetical protein
MRRESAEQYPSSGEKENKFINRQIKETNKQTNKQERLIVMTYLVHNIISDLQ